MKTSLWTALVGLIVSSTVVAAELPAGGKQMIGPEALYREGGVFKTVNVEGQPFARAVEADIPAAGPAPYSTQLEATCPEPIAKGDVVHIRFHARNVFSMSGSANLPVVFELNKAPHSKSADQPVTVGSEWTVVDIPFAARQDFPANGSRLAIRLATAQQKVQIGGLQVINYGTSVKLKDLPRVRQTYAGREANAPWRKAAEERINQLRKSDLKLVVQDGSGKVIPNASVSATMQRHDYGFGTCISPRLLEQSPDGEIYRQKVKELFSEVVLENDHKWVGIDARGYARADQMVQWLADNGIAVRGHCLVWPGERFLPKRIIPMEGDELRSTILKHIEETVTHYKGRLIDWDVINEPYSNHLVMDKLGNGVMVDWFKAARAADPNVKLYINDYSILASGNQLDTAHQRHYYDTIRFLKDNGAPIDGIGMQGHFGGNVTDPENLLKILDRYAALGLRIKVTEFDMRIYDEPLAADYIRDFHIALFSHPAVDGILQWGFWEKSHWIPEAALFSADWSIRPHGQAWIDLVHGQWKTTVQGSTNAAGTYSFRGFHGSYEVAVTANGKTQAFPVRLAKGGGEVVLKMH